MRRWRATSVLLIILLVLVVITGVNYFAKPFYQPQSLSFLDQNSEELLGPTRSPSQTQTAETKLTAGMSLTELAWQIMAVPLSLPASVSSQFLSDLNSSVPATAPGAFTLFGEDITSESARAVAETVISRYPAAEPWLAVDHEGGTVQRLAGSGFSTLPSWRRLCQLSETEQIDWAASTAAELATADITMILGPVVDVASASGVLGSRVCSGDPEEVASAAGFFISAYTTQGILPVIKHYPGIGSVAVDLHRQVGKALISPQDVLPFHTLLQRFPLLGVMTAHVFPDATSEDVCSRDPECVGELTAVYPKALVVSDALDMKSAHFDSQSQAYNVPLSQVAMEAFLSGNDMLIFGKDTTWAEIEQAVSVLVSAAEQDAEIKQKLESSAEKILSYKSMWAERK